MKVNIPKGKYILAVSGGVDSMTLLELLAKQPGLELVVAHFNHGIRANSQKDEQFVKDSARSYQLPYEVGYGRLGQAASEEKAREARYKFLRRVKQRHKADAIVTAHHENDLIETAILNMLRGTGRRGLTSIATSREITRPMLHLSKKEIVDYAKKHNLKWREDPTNQDENLLRNYIRRIIIPKLSGDQRSQLLQKVRKLGATNQIINQEIANLSQEYTRGTIIERAGFIALPSEISAEVLMHFLRQNNIRGFEKKTINRLAVAIKTAKPGTRHDVIRGFSLEMTPSEAALRSSD